MRKAHSLIGLNVISHAGGETLGRVRDLVFDHDSSELLAVVLSEKELFGLIQAQIVPWREVMSVGRDAVIVQSAASRMKAGDDERINEVVQCQTALGGTRLFTTDGQALGTLADVFIDEATGRVTGYEISSGFINDTLHGKRFMPAVDNVQIGKDVAFVPPEAAGQIESRSQHDGASNIPPIGERFNHLVGNAREKAESLYESMATSSADKQQSWVVGRVAARDVVVPAPVVTVPPSVDPPIEGIITPVSLDEIIVRAGETISTEDARRAREAGVLGALTLAAIEGTASATISAGRERFASRREEGQPVTAPLSETFSDVQAKATAKAASAALGKPAGRTVLRPDGTALVEPGDIITEVVLTEARVLGRENEVIAAAGIGAAQAGLESAKEQAAGVWATLKEKAGDFTASAQAKREDVEEQALQKRLDYIAGKRASRLVLDHHDNVIVTNGDVITHAIIDRAREAGVLDVLLDAVEEEAQEVPVAVGVTADSASVADSGLNTRNTGY